MWLNVNNFLAFISLDVHTYIFNYNIKYMNMQKCVMAKTFNDTLSFVRPST